MSNAPVTRLANRKAAPITDALPGWTAVSGEPTMTTWIEYTADDGSMISGWWEASPGTWHATYESWEFIHLIEGAATITPDGGEPMEVGPGDAFVIEKDFVGTWEITAPIVKHFAIKLK